MTDQRESRRRILSLAIVEVEKAAKNGWLISAQRQAQRLLDENPTSEITLTELYDEIAKLAVDRHVAVEFGVAERADGLHS